MNICSCLSLLLLNVSVATHVTHSDDGPMRRPLTSGVGATVSAQVGPAALDVLDCVGSLRDMSGGPCLEASSLATGGKLFPYPGENNVFSAPAVVSGGTGNSALGQFTTVGGGGNNLAYGYFSTVAGGTGNSASAITAATIGGGAGNRASANLATVGGGQNNLVTGPFGTISGGRANLADGYYPTVGGGFGNLAGGFVRMGATVSGGVNNAAPASYSMVAGGLSNTAQGLFSFAAGRRAKGIHDGAFVWGDSFDGDKVSSAPNEFNVYAGGGTRIFSSSDGSTGVLVAPGAGSWTTVSDRNAKENFEAVDSQLVLERLVSIPISTWNYKAQDVAIRHMGPMAQDFYAAFGLGLGGTSIDTIDPDGIALAAIQGLHAELEVLRARIAELE